METIDTDAVKQNIEQLRHNSTALAEYLEKLGHLPCDFDGECFVQLLDSDSEKVRTHAVKNLGKLKSELFLNILKDVALDDPSTIVRREAVSSIGRLRSENGKEVLFDFLDDKDPKIVSQAIRGLLVFKGNEEVDKRLKQLRIHENEVIQKVIDKEFFAKAKTKKSTIPHASVLPYLTNVVVNGDVREVLSLVPEDSIHLTFTSPPYYNARDYSIYPSYEAYLHFLEEVFKETLRTTKEGRFLIVNTSPVIVPRISRAHSSKRYPIPFDLHTILVNMGWEFIDDIIWMKPEYSVKNRVGAFHQHRKPLGYKPNTVTEYLMVYRKPTDKLIDWNMKQYSPEVIEDSKVSDGYETTNVWQINPKSDKVHSAIFPPELCQRVIDYYSFKGDLIFDPFGGSGTLGRTALMRGRKFFTTEIDSTYFQYIKDRLQKASFLGQNNYSCLTLDEFKNTII
jgi:hypothetical protein